jgi:hypothetical protein
VLTGGGQGGRGRRGRACEGLTRAQAVVERRRDGGEEWGWLELGVRAKEGARKLGREGRRCGGGLGFSGVYIGGQGSAG